MWEKLYIYIYKNNSWHRPYFKSKLTIDLNGKQKTLKLSDDNIVGDLDNLVCQWIFKYTTEGTISERNNW